MEKKLTILEKGRFDEIDILSPLEMNNILGGASISPCRNGYCKQSYSEEPDGSISCGCGYVKPIDDKIVPKDPNPPVKKDD